MLTSFDKWISVIYIYIRAYNNLNYNKNAKWLIETNKGELLNFLSTYEIHTYTEVSINFIFL